MELDPHLLTWTQQTSVRSNVIHPNYAQHFDARSAVESTNAGNRAPHRVSSRRNWTSRFVCTDVIRPDDVHLHD
ncbi:hypothetical protein [Erythrobacter sp.]|uniref:hypothetical protein n=1 Tax=Erythrobacter sp. TaxID=1042 RepID=UPI001B07761F|nr:hypothetical protein [Erythrobacter sp.]MBO6526006.1 hypothetical protein [Erythrobacter sp.]MBO6530645.1 hypothetical protein [Erythrobacter sp.]